MPRSRKSLISLDDTPYYHCICRCVRRAFLWGVDQYSGNDYSHRKQWVVDKLAELSDVFAIEEYVWVSIYWDILGVRYAFMNGSEVPQSKNKL